MPHWWPGPSFGAAQPPPCSQIQWAPQLVAPNGLATLMAMAQDCAHGLCTSHTMHSVPLGTCVLLEIEKLFIKNRDILANFGVYWLGGVASVVNTGRPLPPHHYPSHYPLFYCPPPSAPAPPTMRRAAAPEWPARGGCESACVWQCEHAHAVRVCCMWWGMCGGIVGHVDGPWGGGE